MTLCPCGSEKKYASCCEAYVEGKKLPTTPEALMRSRYAAYVQNKLEYIAETMKGEALKDFDIEATRKWGQHIHWLGLEILDAPAPARNAKTGTVEFIAHYRVKDRRHSIHEVSEFQREDKRWFYVDGKSGQPKRMEKIGRNDACVCGSGKKYKKCCAV